MNSFFSTYIYFISKHTIISESGDWNQINSIMEESTFDRDNKRVLTN